MLSIVGIRASFCHLPRQFELRRETIFFLLRYLVPALKLRLLSLFMNLSLSIAYKVVQQLSLTKRIMYDIKYFINAKLVPKEEKDKTE